MKRTWHGILGLAVFAAAASASLAEVQWVRTWFYQLAWWSYILVIDALVQWRTGNSLIVDRTRTFLVMAFVSAAFWFGWELVNLRVANWHYVGVPRELWLRWPGAFVAYATVLPGVLSTYELLTVLGMRTGWQVKPIASGTRWYGWFIGIGLAMFALPMIWPRLFFPLIWGGLVFLLEPFNHRFGLPSLMRDWQKGDLSPFVRLLTAGLITGLVWESWNFLSDARWIYTIPYLAEPKLFAMPLAGFGGFPPFAVECYVFMAALGILRAGRGWQANDHARATLPPTPVWLLWAVVAGAIAFDILALLLIDGHLVKGWV